MHLDGYMMCGMLIKVFVTLFHIHSIGGFVLMLLHELVYNCIKNVCHLWLVGS